MQAKVLQSSARDLYDLDFFEWTGHDAALLRAGRFHEADVQHIAEELEDMGRRERRELLSRLRILLAHLLMWSIQPEHQSRSWRMAITHQRDEIADLLEEMPSLRASLAAGLPRIYRRAARDAVEETGLLRDPFPDACPFYLDQILDASFFL